MMAASDYLEGQIAIIKFRESDLIVAGYVSLGDAGPTFWTAHPGWPSAYRLSLTDTESYVVDVFDNSLEEALDYEAFAVSYEYADSVLELPADQDSSCVLVTAALWLLQSQAVPIDYIRPGATDVPAWVSEQVPALVRQASDAHLRVVQQIARHFATKVLN